jgi:hypothetical protein
VSSKCLQLHYTCSDRLLAIALPPCSFHLFFHLTVTFPRLSIVLFPLYPVDSIVRMRHGPYPEHLLTRHTKQRHAYCFRFSTLRYAVGSHLHFKQPSHRTRLLLERNKAILRAHQRQGCSLLTCLTSHSSTCSTEEGGHRALPCSVA